MEEKLLQHDLRDFLLNKLEECVDSAAEPTNKRLWIDVVRFYNDFTRKGKKIEEIVAACETAEKQLSDVQKKLGSLSALEIVQRTSRFLFVNRKFKICASFLSVFFKHCKKENKDNEAFNKLSKLFDACRKAKNVRELMEEERNIDVEVSNSKNEIGAPYEIRDVLVEDGGVSKREIDAKMKDFERLEVQDQIDKADRYLLNHLKNNRKFEVWVIGEGCFECFFGAFLHLFWIPIFGLFGDF